MLFSHRWINSAANRSSRVSIALAIAAIFLFITLLEAGHHHQNISPQDNCALCAHNLSVEKVLPINDLLAPPAIEVVLEVVTLREEFNRIFHRFFSIRAPPLNI